MLIPYAKPALERYSLVERLKRRGLAVRSPEAAVDFLRRVNYYRFSAYAIPYQNPRDVFVAGSAFEDVATLYQLDEELRNATFAALTALEIFLRTHMVYELSHGWGAFIHYDRTLFRSTFLHEEWTKGIEEEVERSQETFVGHYKAKYAGYPKLPIWMASEVMSLGKLSQMYSGLLPDLQRRICGLFVVHHKVLRNWMHFITFLRNVCAHHGRLWNREFGIRPDIPRREWKGLAFDNKHIYAAMVVMEWMYRKAGLNLELLESVHEKMRAIARLNKGFLRQMGVPDGKEIGMCWEGQ